MNSINPKTAFGAILWDRLTRADRADVCRRAAVCQDSSGAYEVSFVGRTYRVCCDTSTIADPTGAPVKSSDFSLLLLTYLLNAKDLPLRGEWVSEKDLPGGSFFFRGPHALPTTPFLSRYGSNPKAFIGEMSKAGGEVVGGQGDACMRFTVLPRIPIIGMVWAEDEEFPARMTWLFDPTIADHLALDVILALMYSMVYALLPRK